MANSSNNIEPSNVPLTERWYNLTLGSFKDNSSSKFFTLRYEFKPASIDKNQARLLHKNKENRVAVEFQNNQPGKLKVTFEGSSEDYKDNSEDYKDNDCVLFFDRESQDLSVGAVAPSCEAVEACADAWLIVFSNSCACHHFNWASYRVMFTTTSKDNESTAATE